MSKGSGRRPVDEKAFQDNWDKIFGGYKPCPRKSWEEFKEEIKDENLPDIGHSQPTREDPVSGC